MKKITIHSYQQHRHQHLINQHRALVSHNVINVQT